MPRFEKKYVYFMWSDELEGKNVFFADYISNLQQKVENNDTGHYGKVVQGEIHVPFRIIDKGSCWQFVYYDPYYELKVAKEQGKTIQNLDLVGEEWEDIPEPIWNDEPERYRIKPDESKPVTNRELARWLAQGNGEYYEYDSDGWESHRCIEYQYEQDNLPVSNVMVRKWEDEEWVIPTREYMGLD